MPNRARDVAEPLVPFWALAALTFANSLGSGLLWSGMPFVVKRDFGFSEAENFALSAASGWVYVGCALASGWLVARLRRHFNTRAVIGLVLVLEAVAALFAFGGVFWVLVCALLTSAVGALLWPIVESYLASGRHGAAMRRAISSFNGVWMSAVALSLFLMSPLQTGTSSRLVIVVLAPAALFSLVVLRWFPRDPALHGAEHAGEHVPDSYRTLLHTTRVLVPLAYFFAAALGPQMPYLTEALKVPPQWATPLAAVWLVARIGSAVAMGRLSFWHGRIATLLVAAVLLAGGFALALFASSLPLLVLALTAFGIGHGMIYMSGLYYAMAVGHAAIDAGGVFEAMIGLGYAVGPLVDLLGLAFGGGAATVACVWAVAAAAMVSALRPWWRARQ